MCEPEPFSESSSPPDAPPQPGDTMTFTVDRDNASMRLDRFLADRFPSQSRSAVARAIDVGAARIDGVVARGSTKLREGATVRFVVPKPPREGPLPEEIPLNFLHRDEWLAVVDKPPGMVVHPAKGNWTGTLAGALLWHLGREGGDAAASGRPGEGISLLGGPTRPGIVHRLDRDTSGAIVVARSEEVHHHLARQFERRSVEKVYLAVTQGAPQFDRDEIDLPIGIHPYQREKMAIRRDHSTSRNAVTRYEVLERFRAGAVVKVMPKTGRTHQIRVHLAAIGCPVLCDGLYSGRVVIPADFFGGGDPSAPPLIERQALHAASLSFDHPVSGERLTFSAPLPADMERVLRALRGSDGA